VGCRCGTNVFHEQVTAFRCAVGPECRKGGFFFRFLDKIVVFGTLGGYLRCCCGPEVCRTIFPASPNGTLFTAAVLPRSFPLAKALQAPSEVQKKVLQKPVLPAKVCVSLCGSSNHIVWIAPAVEKITSCVLRKKVDVHQNQKYAYVVFSLSREKNQPFKKNQKISFLFFLFFFKLRVFLNSKI